MGANGDQFARLNHEIRDLRKQLQKEQFASNALWELVSVMTSAGEDAEAAEAVEVDALRAEIDALREERGALQEQAAKLIDEGIGLVRERDALRATVEGQIVALRVAGEQEERNAETIGSLRDSLQRATSQVEALRQCNRDLVRKIDEVAEQRDDARTKWGLEIKAKAKAEADRASALRMAERFRNELYRLHYVEGAQPAPLPENGYVPAGEAAHDVG